jgi:2-dehydro-3-deoxygluconokinase
VKVSCDLNYRKNLWTPEQAQVVMKPMMQYVDVLFANEEDSEKVLGMKAKDTDITSGKLSTEGYSALAKDLVDMYGFERVAITLRESISASVNNWSAILYENGTTYVSPKYCMQIVDRVGGGDSFASGLIYATLNEMESQQALNFAVAASCLKHSIEMDFNLSSVEEVMNLMQGDGSGRVVR